MLFARKWCCVAWYRRTNASNVTYSCRHSEDGNSKSLRNFGKFQTEHRCHKKRKLFVQISDIFLQIAVPYDFFIWRDSPQWARASSFKRFLDHIKRRNTVGRTPLEEWSARRRGLYLTTHNTHNRKTSLPPLAFKPTISACERPQTNVLDRAATGIGSLRFTSAKLLILFQSN